MKHLPMKAAWPALLAACLAVLAPAMLRGQSAVAVVPQILPFAKEGKVALTAAPPASAAAAALPKPAGGQAVVLAGGALSTDGKGSASVILSGAGTAFLDRDTEIRLPAADETGHSLELLRGKLFLSIDPSELEKRKAGEFRLKTPAALLAVKGTKFFAECGGKRGDTLGLYEGSIQVSDPAGQAATILQPGTAVTADGSRISQPRPLTAGEKRDMRLVNESALVRSGLALQLQSPSASDITSQTLAANNPSSPEKLLLNGIGLSLDGVWVAADGSNGKPDAIVPAITPEGEARWSLPYDYSLIKRDGSSKNKPVTATSIDFGGSGRLVLKGEGVRAKSAGLPRIGKIVGAQVRFRFKNVSRIHTVFDTRNPFQYPITSLPPDTATLDAPASLSPDGIWEQEFVTAIDLGKGGANTDVSLFWVLYPGGPRDAAGNLRKDTAEFAIVECSLLSLPK